MKSKLLPVCVATALTAVLAAGVVLAPQVRAAEADKPIRLAARLDDPSLPVFSPTPRRRKREPKPSVPPFALPTAPITVTPEASKEPGASPGGSDYPPYEKEMLRLAEILGAVHYLRGLCGTDEGALWRDKMQELIEAEAPNPAWRARLVESFNSGYRGFDRTYRKCTPSAEQAVDLYLAEGRDLTGVIKSRYSD